MPVNNLTYLRMSLEQLELKMVAAEINNAKLLQKIHPDQRISGPNLLHYLALRQEDIREIQDALHFHGLSSLASSESHILSQLKAIQQRLGRKKKPRDEGTVLAYEKCKDEVRRKTAALFGTKKDPLVPFVMVTCSKDLADDYEMVRKLLSNGMNVARLNCAHDNEAIWEKIIRNVRDASAETGEPCKIYMDLGGPKLRTVILGKGRKKNRAPFREGSHIFFAEANAAYDRKEVVIGCSEPGIVKQLNEGERILFDDGLFEARVESIGTDIARLIVLRASGEKPKLKAGKGINFPDSELTMPALTDFDRQCLPFVAHHADLVGYSFVRHPAHVAELQEALRVFNAPRPSLILKIETPEAVEQLPQLLFQGMQDSVFGVMIARGDLAVEIGFERMSEIQEEILWICEAAHVPVIWATQVLENLNKAGIATRAEITDAAYAAHAECVMINKGAYTIQVIRMLRDILGRSGGHHVKKRYVFRPLQIAARFMTELLEKRDL